jgi:hypothetical protein
MPYPTPPYNPDDTQDQDDTMDHNQNDSHNHAQESPTDMARRWVQDVFRICEQRRLDRVRRNRESSARWRAKQDQDELRARQRTWGARPTVNGSESAILSVIGDIVKECEFASIPQ